MCRYCSCTYCPSRMVEHPKSKSTQPRSTRTWDALYLVALITSNEQKSPFINKKISSIQSGASGCEKCFVIFFLKVPLACLGSTESCGIPQRPVELTFLQNLFHNLMPQTVHCISMCCNFNVQGTKGNINLCRLNQNHSFL